MSFDAKADVDTLHKAFKGIGTDEKAVISVMAHRTKEQLRAIAAEYPQAHKHALEDNLKTELSGHFRDLCVGLITDPIKVRLELLTKATKGAGTRERAVIDVLVGSTNEEIQKTNQEDPRIIAQVLDDISGDFKKILVQLMKAVRETNTHVNDEEAQAVAEKLYKAGEGKLGTDETVFIDILAKKSPEFLARVSDYYKAKHKHSLEQAIKSETSGYFEDVLVGLLKPRLTFIADRIFTAMEGAGTDDTCLVYYFSILPKHEIQEVARILQARHNKSMAEMIKGDTSGDYKALLLALISGSH